MGKLLLLLLMIGALAAQERDLRLRPNASGQRKALLVGNNSYAKQPLINAVADASDLAKVLKETGFATELLLNADLRTMDQTIQRFALGLNPGDVALFYFSGHGVSLEGENFLIPTSFAAEMEADVKYQAYSASRVRDLLKGRGVRLSILIFDACRSNPFRSSRSGAGGLTGMSGAGAFIAFAADEGKTADDNPKERNGLFTKHLLTELRSPGVGLETLFTKVRTRVYEESQGRQVPFSYSGLIGEFVFRAGETATAPAPSAPVAPAPATPAAREPEKAMPQFGERRINSRDGQRYIYIPPGRAVIGCFPAASCQSDDLPGREVQTGSGFWIGETEVTRDAWLRVMGSLPELRSPTHLKLAMALQGRLPVTDVTASLAASFCAKVGLRFPTEYEWEYAARAGVQANVPPNLTEMAWLAPAGTTSLEALVAAGAATHAVGQKQPNLWGLYDMLGNAGEFTLATEDQSKVAVRGSSYLQTPDKARYSRRSILPDRETPYRNFGFRCAGPELR